MAGRSPALAGRRRRDWSTTPKASPPPPPRSPSHSSPPSPVQQAGPMAPGTEVEVRVDDDGFHGSWFEAIVGGFVPARGRRSPARYTVTYSHLLSDYGATLVESFGPSHIRPRPPPPSSPEEPLQLHDIVEAFHNDGWWSGIVLATDPLTVAFPITREVITFPPHLVRPRRDYVDGQWVPSQAAMVVQPKLAIRVYEVGEKVEVVRDREMYGYSWFPATVAKVIDSLSYLVEYFDLEEGEGGAKAMEYLHWRFIRPAVEHSPRESEFQLGPGTAVEAYCDGVWSPGVVLRVVGEGEYEVSVDGKETELLLKKVPELLKPQYKWNGKHWRIVSPKRQGNRRQSLSGKRPSSPVRVTSIDDEHRHDTESSATKRSRKELQQLEVMLTEGSEHASESEMDTPLSALCKSPASNHSPQSYSLLSAKNNFQVLSKKVVSGCAVPTKGLLDASSGHPTPQNELRTNGIGETVINEEILSDMMLSECQINTPICGTSAGEACDLISIAELRKQKVASSRRKSAVQQTQERPLSAQALQVKKNTSKQKRGKMNPILAPQGKNDASDNIQLKGNNIFSSMEVICALNASTKCNTPSPLDKQIRASDVVSRGADSGSNTKVLTSKKLARKKGFKESSSPHSSLDATSTVQQRGRKKVAGRLSGSNTKVLTSKKLARKKGFKESSSPHSSLDATGTVQQRGRKKVAGRLKESSIERQLERRGPHTRRQLDRTLEDKMNVNDATNQELLPIMPPGLESKCNGKGSCKRNADGVSETDIHSSLLDEELTATINSTCQANQNADAFTDNAPTQVAEINRLIEKPMLSLDCAVQQDGGKVDERPILLHFRNAGSSQFTMDNTLLRRCSVAGSSMPPHLPLCQISGQQVPFMKTSPVWSLIEAMDVFLKVPQRPHFLPLQQFLPALREGMALGLMVSYASLVESIKKSLIADSIALFEEKINTLAHLEENGFNVQFLQPSLNKLLQIKSDYTKYLGDRDKLKEQMQGKASSVSRMDALRDENDKAIFQLEQKLELLRREAEQIARNKEEEDAELSRLKVENNIVQEACGDAERQFRSILAELR